MSEALNNTGVVVPTTTVIKPKKTRSPINQAQARELTKAETVATAASKADRTAALANRDIDEQFVTAMFTEVGQAREKAAEAILNTTAQREATATQAKAEKSLLTGLKEVQKAAKQKYTRTNRIALAAYFVGKKLNGSKPNLAQSSQTIIEKAGLDSLPGFTPAKVKALGGLRKNWVATTDAHLAAESATLQARAELKVLLKSVKDKCVAVQLAADAEWPPANEEHHGVRKEFVLAANHSLQV